MDTITVRCLFQDEINVPKRTEAEIRKYYDSYTSMQIKSIKLSAEGGDAFIASNIFTILKEDSSQRMLTTPSKQTSKSVFIPSPSIDKIAKGECGNAIRKIAKAIMKQIEKKAGIDLLSALFKKFEEALTKWKKETGIEEKVEEKTNESEDISKIFMEQIQAMKSQIEKLDYEKTQLKLDRDRLEKKVEEDYKKVEEIKQMLKTQGKLVVNEVQTPVQELKDTETHLRSRITELEDIIRNNTIKSDEQINTLKGTMEKMSEEIKSYKEEKEKEDPMSAKYKLLMEKNEQLNNSILLLEKKLRDSCSETEIHKKKTETLNELINAKQKDSVATEEFKAKVNKLCEEKISLQATIEDMDSKQSDLKFQLTKLTVMLSEREDDIAKYTTELSSSKVKIEESVVTYQALLESYKKIDETRSTYIENANLANEKVRELTKTIEELNKKYDQFQNIKNERDIAVAQIEGHKKKIESLTSTIEKNDKLLQLSNDNTTNLRKIADDYSIKEKVWNQKENEYSNEIKKLNEVHSNESTMLTALNKEKQTQLSKIESLTNNNAELANTLSSKEVIIKNTNAQIEQNTKQIEASKKQVAELKQMLEEKYKLVDINKEEASIYEKKITEITKQNEAYKCEIETHKNKINQQINEIDKIRSQYTQEIAALDKANKILHIEIGACKDTISRNGNGANQDNMKIEIEALHTTLDQKIIEISKLKKEHEETKAEFAKYINQAKLQYDTLEAALNEKITQLTIKYADQENQALQLKTKLQQNAISENKGTDESQCADLLKENTDLQMDVNTLKLEKAKLELQINKLTAVISKEKQAKESISQKLTKALSNLIEKEESMLSLNKQIESATKEIKESEAKSKQLINENQLYQQKEEKSKAIVMEYVTKISQLEESIQLASINLQKTALTYISSIKLPDGTPLWSTSTPYPGAYDEVIKQTEQLLVNYDKKYRYNEQERLCNTIIELCQYSILSSKQILDKAGIKCDNINTLIDTKTACEQSPKDIQKWNKLKSLIPFILVPVDSKNREIMSKILSDYVLYKQQKLDSIQNAFGQSRKLSLSMGQKKEEHLKLADMIAEKLGK